MTEWVWIQPKDDEELIERLRQASEVAVPARERENLCAVAASSIAALVASRKRFPYNGLDEVAEAVLEIFSDGLVTKNGIESMRAALRVVEGGLRDVDITGVPGIDITTIEDDATATELALARFTSAMRIELARKREDGRRGWNLPDELEVEELKEMLEDQDEHSPLAIANLAMMIWNRRAPTGDEVLDDSGKKYVFPSPVDAGKAVG